MSKSWSILKKGRVSIERGKFGKTGKEKPHMSFWLDEKSDTRLALWISNDNKTAYFEITNSNHAISAVSNITKENTYSIKKDDLPF